MTHNSNGWDQFAISKEILEVAEIRVPVASVFWILTDMQKEWIESWDVIRVTFLTGEQLKIVEETLNFDEALKQRIAQFSIEVNKCLY